jgi:YD repeat-containing protein
MLSTSPTPQEIFQTRIFEEPDAEHRLTSVTSGNEHTEFVYDGMGRRVCIRQLVNGVEMSKRRFV